MMTIDEMIAVLQGAKDGKKIQSRYNPSRTWQDCDPVWAFDNCDYRVKPEPREIWVNDYGKYVGAAAFCKEDAKCLAGTGCLGQVRFVEDI